MFESQFSMMMMLLFAAENSFREIVDIGAHGAQIVGPPEDEEHQKDAQPDHRE